MTGSGLVAAPALEVRIGAGPAGPEDALLLLVTDAAGLPATVRDQLGSRGLPAPGNEWRSGIDGGTPWHLTVLDSATDLTRERARAIGVSGYRRAADTGVTRLVWQLPDGVSDGALAGLVEGAVAAAHPVRRWTSVAASPAPRVLILIDPQGRDQVVASALVVAQAHCAARDLQNSPANLATPSALAERARQLAAECDHLTATVLTGDELASAGMGAFAAVARGAREPARLIELRYDPPGCDGPLTAWVGKAITFDSGGINLKRGNGMATMKFDMSGGAAVIEAIGAVARLGLGVRLLAIAGATENMPGSAATHPGDIVTTLSGQTVEITNTDAEGRLVLADCLTHAVRSGADRLVDIATLTGAVVTMFGGRYGALMANDDGWAEQVAAAGDEAGELVWRMPLHPWYRGRIDSDYADLANSRLDDGAATLLAGTFLQQFVGGVPWAHIDALAWDLDHEEGLDGGAGFGLRLLVSLAGRMAAEGNNNT